ncbi:hypothetical protein DH2020_018305 [Rehmannia glutinosa]|uniref:Reverse transcriptase n=1 Tax=Rehmannia glutinosa TaxID=99300 RepID=A0ABR0WKJ1_REHGL
MGIETLPIFMYKLQTDARKTPSRASLLNRRFLHQRNRPWGYYLDYFTDIFTTRNPSDSEISPYYNVLNRKLMPRLTKMLCRPFEAKEIKQALFDMFPDKAPGPDGLPALFFQKYWHIVGADLTKALLDILNNNGDLSMWNNFVITLVPKVDNPILVKEFRLLACAMYFTKLLLGLLVIDSGLCCMKW